MKTATRLSLIVGMVVLGVGCKPASNLPVSSRAGGSAVPAPSVATAPKVEAAPPAPAIRDLDILAETELQLAFGTGKEREKAHEKYKDQRWRFMGFVTGRADNTLVIDAFGLREPLLVAMESKAGADKAVLHQEYLFEATVDNFLARSFRDATADSDPGGPSAQEKAADPRTRWQYATDKTIYPGQKSEGTFQRKSDGVWIESWKQGGEQEWREMRRDRDYVELALSDGSYHIRLGDGSATYRIGKGDWEPMFAGNWEPATRPQ